jgi:hypothetical protein
MTYALQNRQNAHQEVDITVGGGPIPVLTTETVRDAHHEVCCVALC